MRRSSRLGVRCPRRNVRLAAHRTCAARSRDKADACAATPKGLAARRGMLGERRACARPAPAARSPLSPPVNLPSFAVTLSAVLTIGCGLSACGVHLRADRGGPMAARRTERPASRECAAPAIFGRPCGVRRRLPS
ncbi:chitin binding domain protein [Burkholderia pseudomallei MSHR346]|nr:chitin binding domain protein [Burkholderia pseudomallei MSHR346]